MDFSSSVPNTQSHFQLLHFSSRWPWKPTEASQTTTLFSDLEFRECTWPTPFLPLQENREVSASQGDSYCLPRAQSLGHSFSLCVWFPPHLPPTPQL